MLLNNIQGQHQYTTVITETRKWELKNWQIVQSDERISFLSALSWKKQDLKGNWYRVYTSVFFFRLKLMQLVVFIYTLVLLEEHLCFAITSKEQVHFKKTMHALPDISIFFTFCSLGVYESTSVQFCVSPLYMYSQYV